jgi:shikimate kinase
MLDDGESRSSIFFQKNIMHERPSNIVLIGMPGSGKSTVGVILAKLLRKGFIDTDVEIESREGRSLQDIVDHDGYLTLRAIEGKVLLGLDISNHVIATGGSAVYSHAAMDHLKSQGILVFLKADLNTLKARVPDFATRGLAKRPDQNVDDLFAERFALYQQYADITVDCEGLTDEEVCARIVKALMSRKEKSIR